MLNALPASDSKYFTKYGADTVKTEMVEKPDCKHSFKLVKAKEAECEKCRAGFFLGVHDTIRKGHIYRKNEFVI